MAIQPGRQPLPLHITITDTGRDINYVYCDMTCSSCPECRPLVEAHISGQDGNLCRGKRRPDYGVFDLPVWTDSEACSSNMPSTTPLEIMTESRQDLPVCSADADQSFNLTPDKVEYILDTYVRAEVTSEVVLFFRGEPPARPEIISMPWVVVSDIRHIMINTNAKRIAYDKGLLADPVDSWPGNLTWINLVEGQADGIFQKSDLEPLPRCFPPINAVTSAYIDGKMIGPLPRVLTMKDYPDHISDRWVLIRVKEIKTSLERQKSMAVAPGRR